MEKGMKTQEDTLELVKELEQALKNMETRLAEYGRRAQPDR